jgi:hypothetical protein
MDLEETSPTPQFVALVVSLVLAKSGLTVSVILVFAAAYFAASKTGRLTRRKRHAAQRVPAVILIVTVEW